MTREKRFHETKLFKHCFDAKPVVAFALTAAVEIFRQCFDDIVVELRQTTRISINTKVIIVPSQFCIQRLEQIRKSAIAIVFAPFLEA